MEEKKYKIFYEKTYHNLETRFNREGFPVDHLVPTSTDQYESSVMANNLEEAIEKANAKLTYKDMMATWSTNITDAILITPEGEQLRVLSYSKKPEDEKK